MQVDVKKLIAAGYTQDSTGIWTRGIDSGAEISVEAYTGGKINNISSFDMNAERSASDDIKRGISEFEAGVRFPIPQNPQEEKSFHLQELGNQIGERIQDQKKAFENKEQLTNNRLDVQISYNNTDKTSAANYAQATLNVANASKEEINSTINALNATYDLLDTQQMYYKGYIFWPGTNPTPAEAQVTIDDYENKKSAIKSQIADYQKMLAEVDANIKQTQSDIQSISAGNTPQRFLYTDEKAQIEEAVKTTSDFYSTLFEKLGEQASTNAQTLAAASKGKQIRSYDDAISAWNRKGAAGINKLSQTDRNAVANALAAMTESDLAKNYQKFSKAFGLVSKAIDMHGFFQKLREAVQSGNWNPVFTNIESLLAGALVADLTAIVFGGLVVGPLSAALFAVLGMMLASYVDDEHMQSLSDWIDSL